MATGSAPPPMLDEDDLHRFVDGLLDPQRRTEVMLRLKASAAEAAQVAAWREQNELLRAAFAGVEHDPIPTSLRLTPLRLRCIGDDERAAVTAAPVLPEPIERRRRIRPTSLVVAAGLCVAAAALGASWLVPDRAGPMKPRALQFVASREPDGLTTRAFDGEDGARGDDERPRLADDELPTATIPDLAPIGFEFTGAAFRASLPKALVFSYRDKASGHLALSVSRVTGPEPARKAGAGTIAWQRGGRSFELSGDGDRLAAAASYLQSIANAAR